MKWKYSDIGEVAQGEGGDLEQACFSGVTE